MKLIVGLGNPGKQYELTRHNIGFMVIDKYLLLNNLSCNEKKFNGLFLKTKMFNQDVIFLKPQKYMNLSGEVIKCFVDYYNINLEDILIVVDDLNLPVGKFRLKRMGTSGGHNGLKNIEDFLQTNNYKRLKIGISKSQLVDNKDYVLGKFNNEEMNTINNMVNKSINVLNDFFIDEFEVLMNKYN